jgi:WD40 repeat protein
VTAGDDHTVRLWDATSGKLLRVLRKHRTLVGAVAYSPDGTAIATGDYNGRIIRWNASSLEGKTIHPEDNKAVRFLAFSPDGRTLASSSFAIPHKGIIGDKPFVGEMNLWDARDGKPLAKPIPAHAANGTQAIAFATDGRLFSGGRDGSIHIRGEALRTLQRIATGADGLTALVVSPDGRQLASGHADGRVLTWDLEAMDHPTLVSWTHDVGVTCVAYSPDGLCLASAGLDGSVRLSDPVIGQELLTLRAGGGRIHGLCFSPDGNTLAAADHSGTILIWRAENPS